MMEKLSRIEQDTTRTSASLEALNTRLFDGGASVVTTLQNNIQEIKDERKSDARWERIHNIAHYSLGPMIVAFHSIARHFGLDV